MTGWRPTSETVRQGSWSSSTLLSAPAVAKVRVPRVEGSPQCCWGDPHFTAFPLPTGVVTPKMFRDLQNSEIIQQLTEQFKEVLDWHGSGRWRGGDPAHPILVSCRIHPSIPFRSTPDPGAVSGLGFASC